MASGRAKRTNAGNRMSKLIEEQVEDEDDEFYSTLYGGFKEEEDDQVYEAPEDQEEDVVDSDFSLSEHEDETNENEEEETKKKRKKVKVKLSKQLNQQAPKRKNVKKVILPTTSPEKRERMRESTISKSEALTIKQRRIVKRDPRKPHVQLRRLTQQELLAEAKITEEKNLASLDQFLKLEEEKKNSKTNKVRYQGPIIRYQSVRMQDPSTGEYCSRNFLEFTDTTNFPRKYFPARVKYPPKTRCVVTGQDAPYKDPLTGLPYANMDAFKFLRDHRKRIKTELSAKMADAKRKQRKKDIN